MDKLKYLATMSLFEHFSEKKKSIEEIISCFIAYYIKMHRKYSFVIAEITNDVNEFFNFKLPMAIVCVGLSKVDFVQRNEEDGSYIVTSDIWGGDEYYVFHEREKLSRDIFDQLVKYVEEKKGNVLSQFEKDLLLDSLCGFLLDYKSNSDYQEYISSFILKNEGNDIKLQIDSIAEGMIIYTGITSDVDEISNVAYDNPIVMYLDTEILFHCAGYNGSYYEQQFNDFFALIQDINKEKRVISLKYFDKTKKDVDDFFAKAKDIVMGRERNIGRIAMNNIIDGCSKERDVIAKKDAFYRKLNGIGISCDKQDYFECSDIHEYCLGTTENKDDIDVLTFINYLRKGKNNKPFLKINYILISGTSLYLDFNPDPSNEKFHSFAISLSHITKILWFSLNKGFGFTKRMVSFDVVCRAKMALSSITSVEIKKKYDDICEQYKNRKISVETAAACILEFKENLKSPESLSKDNVDSVLNFINEDVVKRVSNESALKDSQIASLSKDRDSLNEQKDDLSLRLQKAIEEKDEKDRRNIELSLRLRQIQDEMAGKEVIIQQYEKLKRFGIRLKAFVCLCIELVLLFLFFLLLIFDYAMYAIPFLNGIANGLSITISIIGGFVFIALYNKIKGFVIKKIFIPFKDKWNK